jgi:AcrR family transcriptional regulator
VPRVSTAHLAARRQQILDAARTCFLRNGFHATSMQDIIAEAGLSVGAVYRYFGSKNEIVAAIADHFAGETSATLGGLAAHAELGLGDVMHKAIDLIEQNVGPDGMVRLAVQIWAEALRDEAVAVIAERAYGALRGTFVQLARRAIRTGELPPDAPVEATGAALFSLVVGYGLQRVLTGRPDRKSYKRAVRMLLGQYHPG